MNVPGGFIYTSPEIRKPISKFDNGRKRTANTGSTCVFSDCGDNSKAIKEYLERMDLGLSRRIPRRAKVSVETGFHALDVWHSWDVDQMGIPTVPSLSNIG